MKKHKLHITLMATATLLLAPSCTLLNIGGDKKIVVSEDATVPDDRLNVEDQHEDIAIYNAKDLSQGCIRSDWAIQTVMGTEATGEDVPYLKFDAKTGAVYGNNGCNVLNAKYTYNPQDSTIHFTNLLTTMRYCPDAVSETLINKAISESTRYSWSRDGSNHYIYFYDSKGNEVMTLMHQEFDFLNGIWSVVAINEQPNNNPDVKLVIDIDQMKIHGNTGCNVLNGQLETNPKTVNSISFFAIGVTQRLCPDSEETEKALLVALEEVVYARAVTADKVILLDGKHRQLLELVRTTD